MTKGVLFTFTGDLQDTFDKVVEHLARQGKQAAIRIVVGDHESELDDYTCQYRTADGLKCAAGCLIPDVVYERVGEVIEGNAVTHSAFAFESERLRGLVSSLQAAHDNARSQDSLLGRLYGVAEDYELDDSKVALITSWTTLRMTIKI